MFLSMKLSAQLGIAASLAATLAWAQDAAPKRDAVYPAGSPQEKQEGTDDKKATPSIPGLTSETFTVPPGRYYPEGTFLVRRVGTIRPLKSGDVLFIPDKPAARDSRRRGERPMVLLPSQTLSTIESSVSGAPDPLQARVEISGQLFVYRDRQQLLPTLFTYLPGPADAKPAVKPGGVEDDNVSSVQPTDDPEVSDMITQIESRRNETRSAPQTGSPSEADEKAPKSLVPEGTLVTDRRGRLTRIKGKLAVAFDGDANTKPDPPMIVIPSRALERLEAALGPTTDGVVVVFTGRVLAYRGQNYILPLLAQIEADGQLKPMQ